MSSPEVPDSVRRAARACRSRVDNLVKDWAGGLASISAYAEGLTDQAQVIADSKRVFIRLLSEIGGDGIPDDVKNISSEVGAARAVQGVALDAITAAVRLDYNVIWTELRKETGRDRIHDLFFSVPRIWNAIERHNQELISSYVTTQRYLSRARHDDEQSWFARVQQTDGTNDALNTRACNVLGFDKEAEFGVLTWTEESTGLAPTITATIEALHVPYHRHQSDFGAIFVVQAREEQLRKLSSLPIFVLSSVHGIRSVPAAVRILSSVATILPRHDYATSISRQWQTAIFTNPHDTANLLREQYRQPLASIPTVNRKLLEVTASTYLASGSIALTANSLGCHRNTVINRLAALQTATGLDIRIPNDAMVYQLSLAAEDVEKPKPR